MLNKQFYTLRDIIQPSGIFPLSRSSWLRGIKKGIYPPPLKNHPFGPKSVWTKNDLSKVYAFLESEASPLRSRND